MTVSVQEQTSRDSASGVTRRYLPAFGQSHAPSLRFAGLKSENKYVVPPPSPNATTLQSS